MKTLLLATSFFLLLLSCSNSQGEEVDHSSNIIKEIENQYNLFLELNFEQDANPEIQFCNGYFAGVNWNMFILSGQERYQELANESLSAIEHQYRDSMPRSMGHQLMAGFGTGIKITQNESYKKQLIGAVKALIHEFNPETRWIYYDNNSRDNYIFNDGFESIMKLESLFFVARLTADPVYNNIANKHAEIILETYFEGTAGTDRPVEMLEYSRKIESNRLNSVNLNQKEKFKLNSLIVYSCALLFRETSEIKYLSIAKSLAVSVSEQLNNNEMLAPLNNRIQHTEEYNIDITSLAVLASALYDLSLLVDDKDFYSHKADQIISVLSTKRYFEYENWPNKDFSFHNKNASDDDQTWDDTVFIKEYFFLEALIKRQKLMEMTS